MPSTTSTHSSATSSTSNFAFSNNYSSPTPNSSSTLSQSSKTTTAPQATTSPKGEAPAAPPLISPSPFTCKVFTFTDAALLPLLPHFVHSLLLSAQQISPQASKNYVHIIASTPTSSPQPSPIDLTPAPLSSNNKAKKEQRTTFNLFLDETPCSNAELRKYMQSKILTLSFNKHSEILQAINKHLDLPLDKVEILLSMSKYFELITSPEYPFSPDYQKNKPLPSLQIPSAQPTDHAFTSPTNIILTATMDYLTKKILTSDAINLKLFDYPESGTVNNEFTFRKLLELVAPLTFNAVNISNIAHLIKTQPNLLQSSLLNEVSPLPCEKLLLTQLLCTFAYFFEKVILINNTVESYAKKKSLFARKACLQLSTAKNSAASINWSQILSSDSIV